TKSVAKVQMTPRRRSANRSPIFRTSPLTAMSLTFFVLGIPFAIMTAIGIPLLLGQYMTHSAVVVHPNIAILMSLLRHTLRECRPCCYYDTHCGSVALSMLLLRHTLWLLDALTSIRRTNGPE